MRRIVMRVVWIAALLAITTLAHARMPLRPRPWSWGPLAWFMTEDEAVKALTKANMSPRTDEIHGYIAGATGQAGAHTVEPVIIFVPRKGWTGQAHLTVQLRLDDTPPPIE